MYSRNSFAIDKFLEMCGCILASAFSGALSGASLMLVSAWPMAPFGFLFGGLAGIPVGILLFACTCRGTRIIVAVASGIVAISVSISWAIAGFDFIAPVIAFTGYVGVCIAAIPISTPVPSLACAHCEYHLLSSMKVCPECGAQVEPKPNIEFRAVTRRRRYAKIIFRAVLIFAFLELVSAVLWLIVKLFN